MLPTFVIGLREGLEAALIVGIIAAFLRKQGRLDLLRWVFAGVGTAVVVGVGVGVSLDVLSRNLPQRQQEGLETVVGGLAVAMVTYMVVWMRRHSRELKTTLEDAAASALANGASRAGRAMVVMAFLAVLREGFETVVFLLAAFNETGSGVPAFAGAVLGIAVAVMLGWGIYRGGVRLNLSKFFRATGLVLVLVAAGLVVSALHTAHEAGWINAGQGSTIDLTWLARPGSVHASLLTGMLGVQAHPVVIEVAGWLAYLIPVGLYVAWPSGRSIAPRRVALATAGFAAAAGLTAVVLGLTVPSAPSARPVTVASPLSVQVVSGNSSQAVIHTRPAIWGSSDFITRRVGAVTAAGLDLDRYTTTSHRPAVGSHPSTLGTAAISRLNGGRLPLGLPVGQGRIPVTYAETRTLNLEIEPGTLRVIAASWSRQVTATLHAAVGPVPLDSPVLARSGRLPPTTVAAATSVARRDLHRLDQRHDRRTIALILGAAAALLLLVATGFAVFTSRKSPVPSRSRRPVAHLSSP